MDSSSIRGLFDFIGGRESRVMTKCYSSLAGRKTLKYKLPLFCVVGVRETDVHIK
jgi:hypothetical protein